MIYCFCEINLTLVLFLIRQMQRALYHIREYLSICVILYEFMRQHSFRYAKQHKYVYLNILQVFINFLYFVEYIQQPFQQPAKCWQGWWWVFFFFKIFFQALFEVWHFELFITKNDQNPVIVGCQGFRRAFCTILYYFDIKPTPSCHMYPQEKKLKKMFFFTMSRCPPKNC